MSPLVEQQPIQPDHVRQAGAALALVSERFRYRACHRQRCSRANQYSSCRTTQKITSFTRKLVSEIFNRFWEISDAMYVTGQGCFGKLDIVLAKEKSSVIVVVRKYDLECLQFSQLVEVQVYDTYGMIV